MVISSEMISQPGLIPLDAAGREPVFFFGTLMHEKVLTFVLDRPLGTSELQPARLSGYRRMRARDAVYPVLVADPESEIDGMIMLPRERRDLVRINHFEEDEYEAMQVDVSHHGQMRRAWAYIGLESMPPSDEFWDLEVWAMSDLDEFMKKCAFWMSDAPL